MLTFFVSLFDGLNAAGVQIKVIHHLFNELLQMCDIGLGWLIPSLLGGLGGYIFSILHKETFSSSETQFNK
ncbi:branched-chain amino acid transport system II carrier protein [Priestia filamentosa]|uniref:branched-chain amino acid transport system II carrier protein n=1 Tax=Priestia filamentosa TaxID=1402861 RepID=UPI001F203891|nr:branched-chain amino acid transport system II carrier protein [Priestia filamentosa]MDT3762914.1 branched-chain amino acid transport system II carrier protein [Priestia filamentosa]WCM17859.1 branched-chain amino acid transport system II carrier protein [Priestia filamentosa]WRU97592.1 branched-chain amino acid transport system II carrier protein [Priestia filamentosa]